ncbi:MAG: hypothetical protein IH958_04645 [Chloroflexi bacterium]|nr:hypothetical protein [Chloroflexota bacterium]
MQLILETDEAWSIMTLITAQVVDHAELSKEGRAAVRQWRAARADGTEAMHELAEEINETLGNVIDERTRKMIRRKGRYISNVDRR